MIMTFGAGKWHVGRGETVSKWVGCLLGYLPNFGQQDRDVYVNKLVAGVAEEVQEGGYRID